MLNPLKTPLPANSLQVGARLQRWGLWNPIPLAKSYIRLTPVLLDL